MRRFNMVRQALACSMACVSTAFAETITDLTDYVYLKTADGVTLAPANPLDTAAASTLNVELAAFDAPVAGKIEANVFTLPNVASFDVSSISRPLPLTVRAGTWSGRALPGVSP